MWQWLPILALIAGMIGEILQLIKIIKKRHYSGVSRFKYVIAISMSAIFTLYFFMMEVYPVSILYGVYTLIKIGIVAYCLWLKKQRLIAYTNAKNIAKK